jgi:threonine synthase
VYKIVDFVSRETVVPTSHIYCNGDNPWEVVMDLDEIKNKIHKDYFLKSPPHISKYFPFLPVQRFSDFISMNEGSTPLLRSRTIGKTLGIDLFFKQEFQNPTGSFKDRGSAVELSLARELGVKGITVASTGNMAASCSCYAAAAKIPCFVFVPENTPASKLSQTISFGGRVIQVRGSYNDAAFLAEKVAKELGFYLAGDYAFRVEGHKTAAFELVDEMLLHGPDAVVVPIGCGTNLAGYAKGFSEYLQLGFIDKMPKLIGSQAEGAASVVHAFEKGEKVVTPLKKVDTVCSAIAIARPLDGVKALEALYASNGCAVSVSDRDALEAQFLLSREEGLYVEASCATSVAALIKMKRLGTLPSGRVVCILTGDGLKDPSPMLKMAVKPPTIGRSVEEFLGLYERSFFEGKTVAFVDKSTSLFQDNPSSEQISETIEHHLGIRLPPSVLQVVTTLVIQFLKKGKSISLSDLEDILQHSTVGAAPSVRPLRVIDFEVTTAKDKPPFGKVSVSLNESQYSGEAEGVGPVDAIINALRKACGKHLTFELRDFEVLIRSSGTDAVVSSRLQLSGYGETAVGHGSSPDVIQASIEAFEKAFNFLWEHALDHGAVEG